MAFDASAKLHPLASSINQFVSTGCLKKSTIPKEKILQGIEMDEPVAGADPALL